MMTGMIRGAGSSLPGGPTIVRLGEEDWRAWRDVRLAALADAPAVFGTTLDQARAVQEEGWRAMIREAAIFVATTEETAVGVAAGLPRPSAVERGLVAMWGVAVVAGPGCRRHAGRRRHRLGCI
jgi:hypothetical protein